MSYRIEFDGSLVDNRNLNQVTTSSSLVRNTTASGISSDFEMNFGSLPAYWVANQGFGFNEPPAGTVWHSNVAPATSANGSSVVIGGVDVFGSLGSIIRISNSFFTNGSGTLSIRYKFITNGAPSLSVSFDRVNGTNSQQQFLNTTSGAENVFNVLNVSTTFNSGDWLFMSVGAFGVTPLLEIDYIRWTVGGSTSVSITPSTITDGAQKTGGTLVNAFGETITQGTPAISGPTKELSLIAKDGTAEIAKARSLPPADNTQECLNVVADSKIITAQNTDLTVEASGTGGPERIETGSKVLVEDVTKLEENS